MISMKIYSSRDLFGYEIIRYEKAYFSEVETMHVRDDYLKCVPHVDEQLTQAMCLHPHIFIATQVLSIQIYWQ